jgi:hypothetical protein
MGVDCCGIRWQFAPRERCWRNIRITLTDLQEGEQTAQCYGIACLQQLQLNPVSELYV